jgi:DNA-binding transcriptional LysR family regulator
LLTVSYAVYGHTEFVESVSELEPAHIRWIQLETSLRKSPINIVTSVFKDENAPMTLTSSVMGVFDLVRAGLGLAVLPRYLGEKQPDLVQLHRADSKHDLQLWMLAHPDIRRSARVHAFFEFATRRIREGNFGF